MQPGDLVICTNHTKEVEEYLVMGYKLPDIDALYEVDRIGWNNLRGVTRKQKFGVSLFLVYPWRKFRGNLGPLTKTLCTPRAPPL